MVFILGAFTPLTVEGNIIIDGALASCYAFPDHYLAHIMMTPMRWFPAALELIIGKKDGSPEFINMAQDFGELLLPHGFTYGQSRLS